MILYYLFIISLAFVEHPIFGRSIGGGLTVQKALGAGALVYSVVHLFFRRRIPPFIDTWPARAFLVFFSVAAISYFAFDPGAASDKSFAFHPFNFLLLIFMTIAVVDTNRRLRWTLLCALGSIAWASLYMLREWQGGLGRYGYGYRPGFVCGDPNYFASSALLCVPMAYYFSRSIRVRWIRWGCICCLLLTLAGITVSASRGGLLGLVVSASLMIWHSRRRARTFVGLSVLLSIFLIVSPTSPLDRLLHPSKSDDGAAEIRKRLWGAAWRMFLDYPLTGVGYRNFRDEAPRYLPPEHQNSVLLVHNQYLELLAQEGVPGLLAYLGLFAAGFIALGQAHRKARRSGSRFLAEAALGLQIGMAGYAISVIFLSAGFLRMYWFVISMSACLPAFAARAAARRRSRRRKAARSVAHITISQPAIDMAALYPNT